MNKKREALKELLNAEPIGTDEQAEKVFDLIIMSTCAAITKAIMDNTEKMPPKLKPLVAQMSAGIFSGLCLSTERSVAILRAQNNLPMLSEQTMETIIEATYEMMKHHE